MAKPASSTATRGKRKWLHKPAMDAKRRREAVAAAFDDMDIDEGGAGPFSAPEAEDPDNPMVVG